MRVLLNLKRIRVQGIRQLSKNTNPRPVELENSEAQKEFENLVEQFSIASEKLAASTGETGFDKEIPDKNINSEGVNMITGEVDGPRGKEPTRFGDWERKGRVSDF